MQSANPDLDPNHLWAKSGRRARLQHGRKYFRHELASALAVLQAGLPFEVAYLVAAHHGKVRLAIRALPDEYPLPDKPETLFALGVHDGDPLGTVDLGGGEKWGGGSLDLSPMQLGGDRSWTARALQLTSVLGPFRLAYLETLLRAADARASKKEASNA
jgi:CRISPR-associated endonuclease/helicase Cas3